MLHRLWKTNSEIFFAGHVMLTVSQQAPAELVEGGQGEEGAVSVGLLHQHRDLLSPGQQQPPDKHTHNRESVSSYVCVLLKCIFFI